MRSVNLNLKSLNRPPRGYKKPITIGIFIFCLFSAIKYSPINSFLDFQVMQKTNFKVRSWLNKNPIVDPRIKIMVLDDRDVAKIKSHTLSNDQWETLLKGLGKQKPKAILIDKLFSIRRVNENDFQNLSSKNPFGAPVISASYFSNQKITHRDPIVTNTGDPSIKLLQNNPEAQWIPNISFRYGPVKEILPIFQKIGHINYEKNGKIYPFIKSKDGTLSNYLGISFAEDLSLNKTGFSIQNQNIQVNKDGTINVNMIPMSAFNKQLLRITPQIKKVKKGKPIKKIKEGDVVIILPNFFTGNSDFQETPIGVTPGGFIVASVVNSMLTNQWIKHYKNTVLLIFFSCLFVILLSNFPVLIGAFFTCLLGPIVIIGASLLLFSLQNIAIPWLLPSMAMLTSGLSVYFMQSRNMAEQSKKIKIALGNTIAPERLENFVNNPESFNLTASNQLVSTMFIDMVGFSIAAERQTPEETFEGLKKFTTMARKIIHKHGGIVDKTLGDGILCFFGYSFSTEDKKNENHSDKALACAIEIQLENAKMCQNLAKEDKPIYLLRIGINTSSVYIGDLGGDYQVEFTLIGDGVNYAARLEQACESSKILISATTKDLLKGDIVETKRLQARYITIKHHEEVIEAYEYDPSHFEPALFSNALKAYKDFSGFERKETRWTVPNNIKVKFQFQLGEGVLFDFSKNGLSIVSDKFYSKGVELDLSLEESFPELAKTLSEHRISPIKVEVRWGREMDDQFLHGLLIKNLNAQQKQLLLNELRKTIST